MKIKILVVDDAPSMLLALKAGLEQAGYEVITASSGLSALKIFYKNPPDLIVLDIAMSGIDGWEVCRYIRQTSTVPIIFLTGYYISQEEMRKGLEMGINAYLVKPVSLEDLLGCIQVALNR
jgi:DNA-binding response OmpR family regulator